MQTYMSVHTAVLYAVFIVSALAQGYLCTAANCEYIFNVNYPTKGLYSTFIMKLTFTC